MFHLTKLYNIADSTKLNFLNLNFVLTDLCFSRIIVDMSILFKDEYELQVHLKKH